ncbi:MAG TPA: hypothetical protein VE973_03065 [Candidatus Limnocylindria bacterium]|nr:hypothetical protein [Candidatus Limnocylindria bacterium]
MTLKQKYILGAIILLAIFFRFYQIGQMPGGLFPDEAANGLDINLMQQGNLQPFYERGNGREALFFYMEWATVAAFGKGAWQHDIVSALIGLLSVIFCFLVTQRLFLTKKMVQPTKEAEALKSIFSPNILASATRLQLRAYEIIDPLSYNKATNIALLAAFLMAVSTWHIVLSRTAFRAVQIPLFSAMTIYFLLRVYQSHHRSRQLLYAVWCGISFAFGFYTYIAFRIMAPILFMALLWPLLGQVREKLVGFNIKKYFLPAVFFLVAFTIVIFPIAKYFYTHPGSFLGRAGQVSIFNPNLYTVNGEQLTGTPKLSTVLPVIAEVFKVQMLGFFTHGDLNWRSNISGYPFLSPLFSPFFAAGLIVVTILGVLYFFSPAKRENWWKYFLLTGWFFGMMAPVVTTAEGIPHGLRSIGVIPVVFIISAWALYEFALLVLKVHKRLWQYALFRFKDPQWMKDNHFVPWRMRVINLSLKLLVTCFVLALISQTYFMYFVYAANSPENFYYFRSDLSVVSDYLKQQCDKDHTYLILDKFSVQTTDYLTSDWHGNFNDKCNVPYHQIDPENSWQLTGLTAADQVVFTQSSMFDIKKFKQYHPEFQLVMEHRNKFGQSELAVYKIIKN